MPLSRASGFTEECLTVDTRNPSRALDLYESLGFERLHRFIYYRKPFQ